MCGQRSLLINIEQRVEARGRMFDEGVIEVNIFLIFVGLTVLPRKAKSPSFLVFPDFLHSKASGYVEYWGCKL